MSGRSSGVERNLAKVEVEGSNPFARSSRSLASAKCAAVDTDGAISAIGQKGGLQSALCVLPGCLIRSGAGIMARPRSWVPCLHTSQYPQQHPYSQPRSFPAVVQPCSSWPFRCGTGGDRACGCAVPVFCGWLLTECAARCPCRCWSGPRVGNMTWKRAAGRGNYNRLRFYLGVRLDSLVVALSAHRVWD